MTRIGADRAAGRRPPWWAAVAAVALLVAVPVATWWLVGDQTTPRVKQLRQGDPYPPDYAVFPPPFQIAPATERAVGVVAVALVVVAVVVLVVAWLTGRLHVGWWGVLGLLGLVGAGWGWMWRVMTAVVDEPDFSGIVVVMMVPIGLGLVLVALLRASRIIVPQQLPTAGGSSATTQGRSPTE
jgi:hypothetical protein